MARMWRRLTRHIGTQGMLDERGDVPGWVLVAVMTAGLVTALWFIADSQLTSVLSRAITSVGAP